ENRTRPVVDVEKRLQVGEHIRLPDRLDIRVGELDAVAPRQREHQIRLERSLDVKVKLGLGKRREIDRHGPGSPASSVGPRAATAGFGASTGWWRTGPTAAGHVIPLSTLPMSSPSLSSADSVTPEALVTIRSPSDQRVLKMYVQSTLSVREIASAELPASL